MIALAPILGSVTTIIGGIGGIIAGFKLWREGFVHDRAPRVVAWIFGIYFAVLLLATVLKLQSPADLRTLASSFGIVLLIPLVLLLPHRSAGLTLRGISRAAMIGLWYTAIAGSVASFGFGIYRPELATGNVGVMASMCVIYSVFALIGWQTMGPRPAG